MSILSDSLTARWGQGLCHCRDPYPSFTAGSRIENRTMQGWPHQGRQNHPQRLTLQTVNQAARGCAEGCPAISPQI